MFTTGQIQMLERTYGKIARKKHATITVDGKPEFPIDDKTHARLALDFLSRAKGLTPAQRKKVITRAHRFLGKTTKETVGASSMAGVTRPGLVKRALPTYESDKPDFEGQFDRVGVRVLEVSATDEKVQKATVVLIEAGPGNRLHRHYYTNKLLESAVAAGMFEARQCYANHPSKFDQTNRPERDIKDLLGFFKNARIQYEAVDKPVIGFKVGDQRAMVVADFYPEVGQEFVIEKLRTAKLYTRMFPNAKDGYIGWSIVAGGSSSPQDFNGDKWNVVTEFSVIDSIDMVTRAGAGGRLLNFMEGRMFLGMFGRARRLTESDQKPDSAQLREALAAHVLESLGQVGVKPTSAQAGLIEAGIGVLPGALMTPNFVLTTLNEAGVEVPEESLTKLEEALGIEEKGKFYELARQISETDMEEEDPEEDPKKKDKKDKKEAGDKKKPADDDEDPTDDPEDQEEARKKMEAALAATKNPALIAFVESLVTDNKKLTKSLHNEKKLREAAETQNEKSLNQLREVNAKNLLAKTTKLTEAQKELILEDLASLPTGDQAKQLSKYERFFSEAGNGTFTPAARFRESNRGAVTINAMRD